MFKGSFFAIAEAIAVCPAAPAPAATLAIPAHFRQPRETAAAHCAYAAVNGMRMYYEVLGTGRPLVLLHGGLTTIDFSFQKVRPALARSWTTVAIEQQAHGHTADIDRPLSYEQMAEDTATLLRRLKIQDADFFGWSDGGNIALRIAMRHPDLVRKLVVAGANYSSDGLDPQFVEYMKHARAEDMPEKLRDAYLKVAPNPQDWPKLVAKVLKLGQTYAGWRSEDLQSIKAPTLVLVGDDDIVRPEHAVQMFRLLPHAQLSVLPGSDHFVPLHRPEWTMSIIETFLNAPMPRLDS